jgi:DUF1009 family protein
VHADNCLIIEQRAVTDLADRHGLFVIGVGGRG